MSRTIKVNASILCADFNHMASQVKMCEDAGVDMFHVDVMDGHFVPVISMGPIAVEAIRKITPLPIETHLMVENPGRFISDFISAGADIVSIHSECYGERREHCQAFDQYPKEIDRLEAEAALEDIRLIKSQGKRAHMVLNPGTPFCLEPVLEFLDGVLIMSVNPGFARQKFMPVALEKVEELRAIFEGDIAIDGGLNSETSPLAVKAGANIIATASYFFGAQDKKEVVRYLKSL